jgi:pilus assembly protein Flp/PilA
MREAVARFPNTARINELFSMGINGPETSAALDCVDVGTRLSRADARQEFAVRQLVSRFIADQTGATAIEYALIAAGISIVIVAAVNGIGTAMSSKFTTVSTALK